MGVEFQTHPIMNIKRNIIFALESRKKNGVPIVENVPIRMRVIFASQRIEFTTGYRIDVAKWDADKQRVKNGCTNKLKQSAAEINTDLLKYYAEIQNIFKEFEVQEVMPTTQQLKEAFNMRMKDTSEEQPEEAPVSFWEVFDEFVKECGNQNNWTASTYEKFAAVRNHLKEFKEDATFNYFDEFGLNEYVNFLRDTKDMRNSTIGKQMGFLKFTLNKSDDMNIRLAYHYEQKQKVAKKAVESIQYGETIMIESGSCCALVALEIAKTKKDVTLITNSAFIADYIRKHTAIKIILLGGEYQHESQVISRMPSSDHGYHQFPSHLPYFR